MYNCVSECILCAEENEDLLNNPELWTIATVHMTPHKNGMVNIKKLTNTEVISMGDESKGEMKEIADVNRIICRKDGTKNGTNVKSGYKDNCNSIRMKTY
jgi:hypothetical protein